jgi:hypothetical protein
MYLKDIYKDQMFQAACSFIARGEDVECAAKLAKTLLLELNIFEPLCKHPTPWVTHGKIEGLYSEICCVCGEMRRFE